MPAVKRKIKKSFGDPAAGDSLESLLQKYIDNFISHNPPSRVIANDLRVIGIGLRPVIDHLAFCTLDIHERVKEFLVELDCDFHQSTGTDRVILILDFILANKSIK